MCLYIIFHIQPEQIKGLIICQFIQNIVVKNIFSIYDFGKSIKYYILELETLGFCFFNIIRKENVMKLRMKKFVLCAIACFAIGVAGCGEKGTTENVGEKVGKEVDKTIESAKDAIQDAESAAESAKDATK